MKATTRTHGRRQRTPKEQVAYHQQRSKVSPAAAIEKLGPEDYQLFCQFQQATAAMRAEELKEPGVRNDALLAKYRQQATKAASRLYERHHGLVYKIVKQFITKLTGQRPTHREQPQQINTILSEADLVQEGCTGLLIAFEDFVPQAGNRFATYAWFWIYQAVSQAIMPSIELPDYLGPLLKQLKQVREKLEKRLQRLPTDEELAQKTGMNRELFRRVRQAEQRTAGTASLDRWYVNKGDVFSGYGTWPFAADSLDNAAELDRKNLKGALNQAMQNANLTKRERVILEKRFGLNMGDVQTLAQIAKQFKITRERVRQIEKKALQKMASRKAGRILEPYQYLIT